MPDSRMCVEEGGVREVDPDKVAVALLCEPEPGAASSAGEVEEQPSAPQLQRCLCLFEIPATYSREGMEARHSLIAQRFFVKSVEEPGPRSTRKLSIELVHGDRWWDPSSESFGQLVNHQAPSVFVVGKLRAFASVDHLSAEGAAYTLHSVSRGGHC
jgi:hypothetical protein